MIGLQADKDLLERGPGGTEDLLELGGKPDEIADVLAVMWYRAIFFEDPPAERLRSSGRRLIGPGPRAAASRPQKSAAGRATRGVRRARS